MGSIPIVGFIADIAAIADIFAIFIIPVKPFLSIGSSR
jgi:hypothetical protein